MNIEKETVRHIALLSRLELDDRELGLYSKQLESILGYISTLNELKTDTVQPTSHVISNLKNVYRKDSPRSSLPVDRVLAIAPATEGNFIRIPKVIEGK